MNNRPRRRLRAPGAVCFLELKCLQRIRKGGLRLALVRFDLALIAQARQLGIDGELCQNGDAVLRGDLVHMALPEDIQHLAAVGTAQVAHVFHKAEHGNMHQLRHADRLLDDHGDKLLRGGDDDDAVYGERLEYRQRHIARSGRQIDKHPVDLAPNDIRPELLDGARDDGTAPHDRVGLLGQQQIDAHNLDAGFGESRENAVVICGTVAVQPEYLGNGRAGDIGIQNGDFFAAAAHCDCEQRGDKRFSDAALAADDTDHFFDMGLCILRGKQRRALAGGAVFAAGRAIMRTFRHEKTSFLFALCAAYFLYYTQDGAKSKQI